MRDESVDHLELGATGIPSMVFQVVMWYSVFDAPLMYIGKVFFDPDGKIPDGMAYILFFARARYKIYYEFSHTGGTVFYRISAHGSCGHKCFCFTSAKNVM